MKFSDRLTGGFLVILGACAYIYGSRLPPVPGQPVGPNVFPMIIGAGLVVLGALIAFHFGRSFEEEAEAEVVAHSDVDPDAEAYAHRRRFLVWLPPALLVFYYIVSERIGFLPTAAMMIAAMALAFNARRMLILPVALGGAFFIQLVFVKLLRVPLPPIPFLQG